MLVAMMFTRAVPDPEGRRSGAGRCSPTRAGKRRFAGPWAVETIAREQMVDAVAHELGMDPLELRRRNVIHQSDLPYAMPRGMVYDVVTPSETLEQAVGMLDWEAFRTEQAAARTEGRYLGAGLSVCVEPSAVGMGGWATEQAIVRIDVSGQVEVLMGTREPRAQLGDDDPPGRGRSSGLRHR